MPTHSGRFLRENVFLVAAVALPLVIVGLFLLVTAIPRWTVPPPASDLLLQTSAYDSANATVSVEFVVENRGLQARIRQAAPNTYPPRPRLWLFDHTTLTVREVALDLPRALAPGESTRTVPIDALAGRRVVNEPRAPDGYELQSRTHRGAGLLGDLFGMGRYDGSVALVNRGRVVPIRIGSPSDYQSPQFVGLCDSQHKRTYVLALVMFGTVGNGWLPKPEAVLSFRGLSALREPVSSALLR